MNIKKRFTSSLRFSFGLLLLMSCSSTLVLITSGFQTVSAAFSSPEGHAKVSVVQLKNIADDSWVTLEGRLIRHIGGEDYLFRDASGEVVVEIDHELWGGIQVGADDMIRISGEVDHNWNKTEIGVESLSKIGKVTQQTQGGFVEK